MNQPYYLSTRPQAGVTTLPFGVAVHALPGSAVIRLTGELDLEGVARLAACAGELPLGGAVDIDLTAVTFLDTSGLAALVAVHGRLTGRGCTVRLLGPQGRVLRLLDLAMDAGWLPTPVDCPERPDWALVS